MKYKKLLPYILVIILTASNILVIHGEDSDQPSWWAVLEVGEARTAGISVDDVSYREEMSRLQFCKWIIEVVELVGESDYEPTIESPFSDTDNSDVTVAYEIGIVEGIGGGLFAPNANITRQEVVVMLVRMIDYLDDTFEYNFGSETKNLQEDNYLTYDDDIDIASWAKQEIYRATALGIVEGIGHNLVDPLGFATNEQGILLAIRIFNEYKEVVTFEVIDRTHIEVVNELETVRLVAAELVKSEQVDLAYFDMESLVSELGEVEYIRDNGVITEIRIHCYGLYEDENEMITVFLSNGIKRVEQVIILRVEDLTNFVPEPKDNLVFEMSGTDTLVINATDLVVDPDGDYVSIEGYKRIEGGFGTGVLENQMSLSRFTFTPQGVSELDVQKYLMTVSDGIEVIEVLVEIHIHNVIEND